MSSRNKKIAASTAAVVLLGASAAWAFGLLGSEDPVVAEMKQKAEAAFGENGSDADRRAFFESMRSMTDAQRQQFGEWARPRREREMTRRVGELLSTPTAELADRIVSARANRPERGGGGGPGGGRRGSMTDSERDARRKGRLDSTSPSMRAQFSSLRTMVNQELESRGEPPLSGRDMRSLFGGGGRGRRG